MIRLNLLCRQILIALLCFLVGLGILRHRVMQIGQEMVFQNKISKEKISRSFFEHFHASPLFVQLHHELTDLMFYLNKTESVWLGPRLQWAYADFNITSPVDQPVWWHVGVSYPSSQEEHFVNSWKEKRFDVLIFFGSDMTYLPEKLVATIQENYFLVSNQSLLTVLHQKNQ